MTSSIRWIVELSSRSQSANIQCKCVRFLASEIILVAASWFVNSVIADQNPHPSRCLSLLVTLQLRFPDLWRVWDSPCGGGLWRPPQSLNHGCIHLIQLSWKLWFRGHYVWQSEDKMGPQLLEYTSRPNQVRPSLVDHCVIFKSPLSTSSLDPLVFPFGWEEGSIPSCAGGFVLRRMRTGVHR